MLYTLLEEGETEKCVNKTFCSRSIMSKLVGIHHRSIKRKCLLFEKNTVTVYFTSKTLFTYMRRKGKK